MRMGNELPPKQFQIELKSRSLILGKMPVIPRAITTLCRNLVANVWSTWFMERFGWRSPQAFKLAAMRKTGHGCPVYTQTTILPCA